MLPALVVSLEPDPAAGFQKHCLPSSGLIVHCQHAILQAHFVLESNRLLTLILYWRKLSVAKLVKVLIT